MWFQAAPQARLHSKAPEAFSTWHLPCPRWNSIHVPCPRSVQPLTCTPHLHICAHPHRVRASTERRGQTLGMRGIGEREEQEGERTLRRREHWCPQIWGTPLAGPMALSPAWCGIPRKGKRGRGPGPEAGKRTAKAPAALREFKPLGRLRIPGTGNMQMRLRTAVGISQES